MKKTILASLFLALLTIAGTAHAEPPTRESIKQLMQTTGASNSGIQMIQQMKKMLPGTSPEIWDQFKKDVNLGELENLMIPIYQKHLTQEDVAAMNKFYSTPTGKKLITKMPMIMQESMVVGQKWGQGIAYKLIQMQQKNSQKKKQQ